MKQLGNKASSPWELKETVKDAPPAQWTELTEKEEQEKKREQKKTEEAKATHYRYCLQFPPFGWHFVNGCRLDQAPPEIFYLPVMSAPYARSFRGNETPDRGYVMIFRNVGRSGRDDVDFLFTEIRQ